MSTWAVNTRIFIPSSRFISAAKSFTYFLPYFSAALHISRYQCGTANWDIEPRLRSLNLFRGRPLIPLPRRGLILLQFLTGQPIAHGVEACLILGKVFMGSRRSTRERSGLLFDLPLSLMRYDMTEGIFSSLCDSLRAPLSTVIVEP